MNMHATKNVAANIQRNKMLMDANAQNDAKAGSADDEEIANATRSVRDVTVIDAPARESARAPRLMRLVSSSDARETPSLSRSNALAITKQSSTPIPRRTNGSTLCTGPYSNPIKEATPNPATVDNATRKIAANDMAQRLPLPQLNFDPSVAPTNKNAITYEI
mmetsp:Transcript_11850/g.17466  ORF Transcript_11850/g.17466 Transcript_11850/m.17466 type:complete len:163 (-) Transcript_11850:936-1424(-)